MGGAGSRGDTRGMSNGLLTAVSRTPSLLPADGSWNVWAQVAGRKTLHAAEMFPASSDDPEKRVHQVPGSGLQLGWEGR